ncbi:MAG: DUF2917 domain-containing protein [Ramlibacter sp.]
MPPGHYAGTATFVENHFPGMGCAGRMQGVAMNIRLNTSPVCLAKSQAVTLTDAKGSLVRCLSGGLWITQDRDQRDIVLEAGESFTIDRGGPAIVWALAASSVEVVPRRQPAVRRDEPGLSVFRRFLSARSFQAPSLSS